MTNAEKIMTAALTGAVVGLVAGILFAPDKGSATRQRIADTTDRVTDKLKQVTANASETIGGLKQKLLQKKEDAFQGDEASIS